MKEKIFYYSIILVLIDQLLKYFCLTYLTYEFVVIPGFFSLYKIFNTGAAFSLFSGNVFFLIIINFIVFLFLLKYQKSFINNFRNSLAFILLFGGLFGNLIDRVRFGYVVDYLKFDFGNYTFPIFNFADICLCIGMFLLIYAVYKKEDMV